MNNIKIAYFAGSMKPGHDGVTRVLYRLADELVERGTEALFVSAIIPPPAEQKVPMVKVPSIIVPFYKEYKISLPGAKYFEDTLDSFNPDIIHINSPCSLGRAALKYAQRKKIPAVATYHTHFPSYAKYYKVKAFETWGWNYLRLFYNKCESVFVPSLPILDELKEHGFRNGCYLPHGVDTKVFNPDFYSGEWKQGLGLDGKTIVLYSGRLVWEKDLKTLAEVYSIIIGKRNDIKFVLAGDGPIKNELKALMPGALFLGYKSGEELSAIYASSDIFLFPSTTETYGNVVIEAMASGLPPVCAKKGGAYGIINDKITGFVCEPGNSKSFAEKVEMLADNKLLRNEIARNAIMYAGSQDWKAVFTQLFEKYGEAVDNYNSKIYFKVA